MSEDTKCMCRIIGGHNSAMGLKTSWTIEWVDVISGKIFTTKVMAWCIEDAIRDVKTQCGDLQKIIGARKD